VQPSPSLANRSRDVAGPQQIHADATTAFAFSEKVLDDVLLHPIAPRCYRDWGPTLVHYTRVLNPRLYSCFPNGLVRMFESDDFYDCCLDHIHI
jgi:hypothetical protein